MHHITIRSAKVSSLGKMASSDRYVGRSCKISTGLIFLLDCHYLWSGKTHVLWTFNILSESFLTGKALHPVPDVETSRLGIRYRTWSLCVSESSARQQALQKFYIPMIYCIEGSSVTPRAIRNVEIGGSRGRSLLLPTSLGCIVYSLYWAAFV